MILFKLLNRIAFLLKRRVNHKLDQLLIASDLILKELNRMALNFDVLNAKVDDAVTKLTGVSDSLTNLAKEVQETKALITDLKSDTPANQAKIDAIAEKLNSFSTAIDAAKASVDSASSALDAEQPHEPTV